MTDETQARTLVEQNLQHFAQCGVPRKKGDVEACLQYRRTLSSEEQQLYDNLLREGNYAGSAAELLEVYSGREKPHSEAFTPTIAKAP